MVIFADKTYQTKSGYPDTDFTNGINGEVRYIVPDGSELANKVEAYYPDYDFVTDGNGNLIDVVQTEHKVTADDIKAQLAEIDAAEIRPLAAIGAGLGTDTDIAKLQDYENKKSQLRAELAELEQSNNG